MIKKSFKNYALLGKSWHPQKWESKQTKGVHPEVVRLVRGQLLARKVFIFVEKELVIGVKNLFSNKLHISKFVGLF